MQMDYDYIKENTMHKEVREYIKNIKKRFPECFKNKRVLELGSLNYNGTVREYFDNCEYIGVDRMNGEGVDVVCNAHEFDDKPFDVVISTEMLEHDKYAKLSLRNAMKLLKKGGILIVTAAGTGREKHYEFTGEDEHYENITKEAVNKAIGYCEVIEENNDIRFFKIKI